MHKKIDHYHVHPCYRRPEPEQGEAERQEAWLAQRRGRTERHRKYSEFR